MSGANVLTVVGLTAFQLAYEISPIILNDGVAQNFGGVLPIVVLTEAIGFANGLLQGSATTTLSAFFGHFWPQPGATLYDFQVAQYPFANQTIAANSMIAQPLRCSFRMDAPANGAGGYVTKLATMMALQATLKQHALLGGTYTLITPSFISQNWLLLNLRDGSAGEGRQAQTSWIFDFEAPLITQAQAAQAVGQQNSLISQASAGTPFSGELSWSSPANSNLTSANVPTGSGLAN